MIQPILADITIPGITGLVLKIPDPGGIFSGGLLSGVGTILQLAFGIILTLWVILSLFAGYTILRSQGNTDKIQEGMTKFKYVWISVSAFFGFFVLLSIVGVIAGFGTPVEWGNTLAQCGGYDGPFYFSQIDQQTAYYFTKFNVKIGSGQKGYCCKYTAADNAYVTDVNSPLGFVSNLGINNDGYNWYLPLSQGAVQTSVDSLGNVVLNGLTNTGFTECTEYGK